MGCGEEETRFPPGNGEGKTGNPLSSPEPATFEMICDGGLKGGGGVILTG